MRVLVFGESATQGFWDRKGGWVARLQRHYDNKQMDDFSIEQPRIMNLGIAGTPTDILVKRFECEAEARLNEKGMSFIFAVGGNNSCRIDGKLNVSPEKHLADIEKVIKMASKFSDKIMFVGLHACDEERTNPVAWADVYFKNKDRKLYEDITADLCDKHSLPFLPLFKTFKERLDNGEQLLSHDGIHPGDGGHKLIFELVQPQLDKLLS